MCTLFILYGVTCTYIQQPKISSGLVSLLAQEKTKTLKNMAKKKSVLFMFHWGKNYIPANCPDFIGTVPIFDFQNLQKLEHPDFLEFQPVNIQVFNIIFKT